MKNLTLEIPWHFESVGANIVQGLVIQTNHRVSIFNELMKRQGSIVRLNNLELSVGGKRK
jgi:hypothetical protein